MASGETAREQSASSACEPFPAARVDAVLDDDLTVRLGALELRAIATQAMRPARWLVLAVLR